MEDIKESLNILNSELENNEELEGNELYFVRENKLKNMFEGVDRKLLFKFMFLRNMNDVDLDDKIVILYHINRFDKEDCEKSARKMGIVEGENNISDFKSVLFNKIKELIIKGLEIAKDLIKEKFDEFLNQATQALGEFLKQQGLNVLEKIIDSVRGGVPVQTVEVKVDGKKMALCDVLSVEDCQKIADLSDVVDDIYDNAYRDINHRVREARKGKPIEDFNVQPKPKDKEEDKKDKKDIKDNNKSKTPLFCCF